MYSKMTERESSEDIWQISRLMESQGQGRGRLGIVFYPTDKMITLSHGSDSVIVLFRDNNPLI